jgi:hypothetical protein
MNGRKETQSEEMIVKDPFLFLVMHSFFPEEDNTRLYESGK